MKFIHMFLSIALFLMFMVFTVYSQAVFINEIHYDNASSDTEEGVEIAGPAGTNLEGWQIIPYNGNGGASYTPVITITGTLIPDEGNGFGAVWFALAGLQNGAPDGIALVNNLGTVIQFISYEGTFAATNGAAIGLTSVDIGVLETGSELQGLSLQLTGTGSDYSDFTWNAPSAYSHGLINVNQTFVAQVTTKIQFSSSAATVDEGDGSYVLHVTIVNPSSVDATTADVALISGNAADLGNYTTTQVVFPAGNSSDQTVTINITDDLDIEGNEQFEFELQNISGGLSASAGIPSQFLLTVNENDFAEVPAIVINEIMKDPVSSSDSDGEWIELYNNDIGNVDINGWILKDEGTDIHTINNGGPLVIAPGSYLILGVNDTFAVNGGVNVDYVYSSYFLSNADDEVILVFSDGVSEVDRVNYDSGTNFPDPIGASMELVNPNRDNNVGANWLESSVIFGAGDLGTPGGQNSQFVSLMPGSNPQIIRELQLYQNFPNPFNPSTTLMFDAPASSQKIDLAVYDVLGKKVRQLLSGNAVYGLNSFTWDGLNESGHNMPSGVYFAVLKSGDLSQTVKMMLLR